MGDPRPHSVGVSSAFRAPDVPQASAARADNVVHLSGQRTPSVTTGRYHSVKDRVETYFDATATREWEKLTSDEKVSRIRATVRKGRDRMRAIMLSRLPADLGGTRILDAGCGAGQMSQALAERGAEVVGVDVSPQLLGIAAQRMPRALSDRVTFRAGDMTDPVMGRFDHVVAMDSLLYYDTADVASAVAGLAERTRGNVVFTVAPRTPLLMAMWGAGRLFPRGDRSPVMVPQNTRRLARALAPLALSEIERVHVGFYISTCLEVRE